MCGFYSSSGAQESNTSLQHTQNTFLQEHFSIWDVENQTNEPPTSELWQLNSARDWKRTDAQLSNKNCHHQSWSFGPAALRRRYQRDKWKEKAEAGRWRSTPLEAQRRAIRKLLLKEDTTGCDWSKLAAGWHTPKSDPPVADLLQLRGSGTPNEAEAHTMWSSGHLQIPSLLKTLSPKQLPR